MSRRAKGIVAGVGLLTACAGGAWVVNDRIELRQYRQVPADGPLSTIDDGAPPADGGGALEPRSLEIHRKANEYEYALAAVEFTDQGFFWDARQLTKATEYIDRQIQADRGAVVVVFAHGWNNNAAPDNQNAACFQEVLKAIGILQASYHANDPDKAPAVVGVYLGWRGLVFRNVRLNQALTFWNRAKVADRIGGRGDLVETLLAMSQLRAGTGRRKPMKLIIVGHSFGARAVFSGLGPFYNAALGAPGRGLAKAMGARSSTPIDAFADLVVLVNPAFSADQFIGLDRRLSSIDSTQASVHPSLIVAGSVADQATRLAYPGAYLLSGLVESFAPNEKADALKITVGNYPQFVTDKLEIDSGTPMREVQSVSGSACRAMNAGELDIVRGRSRLGPDGRMAMTNYETIRVSTVADSSKEQYSMVLKWSEPRRSVMAVAVDEKIIGSHSEIFTGPFTEFLTRVVNAKAAWAAPR